jgi:hypothetical protein
VLEFLVEAVVELAIELVFQGGGELLVEGVARLLGVPFGRRDRSHPVAAGASLLLIGALLGLASWWVWPYRIVASGPYPGISLVISPLVNGLLANALGTWRVNHDRPRTYPSTFWGGALFALGMAGVRFWLLGAR